MEIAELVLAYVKVLAWPLVALFILMIFRRQIIGLLGRVRRAKMPGFEFHIADQIRELSEQSETLPELAEAQKSTKLDSDGAVEPEPATLLGRMLIAWSDLEHAASEVAFRRGSPHRTNLGVLFADLHSDGVVSLDTALVARSLQDVRNIIVHRATEAILLPDVVENFAETARNLATVLRAVPQHYRWPKLVEPFGLG